MIMAGGAQTAPDVVGGSPAADISALRRANGWPRQLIWTAVATVVTVPLAFLTGFLWFACAVPLKEVALDKGAEGIVALTGGASRVADAVELLAAGRGQRLLISGVDPRTKSGELARRVPDYERLFSCCIDLDHARNTTGNAVEARRWTRERGFRSLVVVTSSYHMPRAMAELSYRLPGVRLIPYPVVTEQRAVPWWASAPNARLLFSEYLKYLAAVVRMRLEPV